jgi:hypothetical protein
MKLKIANGTYDEIGRRYNSVTVRCYSVQNITVFSPFKRDEGQNIQNSTCARVGVERGLLIRRYQMKYRLFL